jgi:peptidoglycan/xylan/chitin deacetylase (PgdA/CDA1 family)
MRLAAAACALAILVCVAVVGAVLAQKTSVPASVPVPALATPAPAPTGPVVVVRDLTEPAVAPAPKLTDGRASAPAAAPAPVPAAPIAAAPAAPIVAAPIAVAPIAAPPAAPIVVAQAPPRTAPGPAPAPAPPPAASAVSCPGNPNALGVARTVEIDTTGGPGFGFEHFKSHDFLREGEVVLTFDDGPWPKHTPAVLAALAAHCTKAIFFPIGLHATYDPAILKQVAAAGHAVGSHTWCHQDLSKTKGTCLVNGKRHTVEYDPKDEIEKGISAVRWAVGGPTAPYFRFPALRQPPELIEYLGKRNIAIFSTDFDSFDFKMRKPEEVRKAMMTKLKKHGKGIALMHDFQGSTAAAAAELMNDLKAGGYKIVHMKPKGPVTTIASYDEMILKQVKGPSGDGRPTSSVVRTISE